MAQGFNIAVPLRVTNTDGPYSLTKTFNKNARQNLKMILLTGKGEKISDIDFGCGLKSYLFGQPTADIAIDIETEIREQVSFYAPYILINDVQVSHEDDEHFLAVLINYTIPYTNTIEETVFEVTT